MTNKPSEDAQYTQDDEAKMDRAAQAGAEGAFGANSDAQATLEGLREDAEAAFSAADDTDASGSGATGNTGSGTSSSSTGGGELSSGVNLSGGSSSKP